MANVTRKVLLEKVESVNLRLDDALRPIRYRHAYCHNGADHKLEVLRASDSVPLRDAPCGLTPREVYNYLLGVEDGLIGL